MKRICLSLSCRCWLSLVLSISVSAGAKPAMALLPDGQSHRLRTASNPGLHLYTSQANPEVDWQIQALKNSIYAIFFREGVFAGIDQASNPELSYQLWQVPLIIGSLLAFNRYYLGSFHDFLPVLAKNRHFSNSTQLLGLIYKVNNWDTFPAAVQPMICAISRQCFIIDDRLWWVNALISYAEGLASHNPDSPQLKLLIDYAYRIFIRGITRPAYVNTLATGNSYSVMWHSSIGTQPYYKATIANSLYVSAGARLAQLIKHHSVKHQGDHRYTKVLATTLKVADGYFLSYSNNPAHHLKRQGLLLDGVGTGGGNGKVGFGQVVNAIYSYNQGVVLPGMAILSQLTHQAKYLNYAKQLIDASITYAQQHDGFFDDYAYLTVNGWLADSDGIAFRLAYWQYLSLFVANYKLSSDLEFSRRVQGFVNANAAALIIRRFDLAGYLQVRSDTFGATAVAPNHGNWAKPAQGHLFSTYPDGYSLPGISAALEILILQQRLNSAFANPQFSGKVQ